MTRIARPAPIALVLLAIAAAQAPGADRRPISETDLLRFTWAADPQVAPDGKLVAFVRVGVDREKDDYETSIWVVPFAGGEPRRAHQRPARRLAPVVARRLAAAVPPPGEGRGEGPKPPQVYLLPLDGGEPRP